ncbi:hypothetical protein Ae263Ps1_4324c [Pseudonocardia sp. Ae263_Ps1]|nr:hypothetical protein Ae263Ps1_4324c [Pseudonocardia sp. Ae263_Ps1]
MTVRVRRRVQLTVSGRPVVRWPRACAAVRPAGPGASSQSDVRCPTG